MYSSGVSVTVCECVLAVPFYLIHNLHTHSLTVTYTLTHTHTRSRTYLHAAEAGLVSVLLLNICMFNVY